MRFLKQGDDRMRISYDRATNRPTHYWRCSNEISPLFHLGQNAWLTNASMGRAGAVGTAIRNVPIRHDRIYYVIDLVDAMLSALYSNAQCSG